MATLVATQRISTALSSRLLPITQQTIYCEKDVRVYREGHHQWGGTFVVRRVYGKKACIADGVGRAKQFRIALLLP